MNEYSVADEILSDDISERTMVAAQKLFDGSKYTTHALYALAEALGEHDETGADLVRQFAKSFASHEANTV